jgi:hypothetical protein
MMGSTGLSIRIREERRLLDEAGLEKDSEKLEWLFGGRGEREREVERELWPERVGRIGMWMERDRRREAMPLDDREVFAAVLCLRGLVVPSPAWEDPAAELGAVGGVGAGVLSHEMVACLRMTPGLEEAREAA